MSIKVNHSHQEIGTLRDEAEKYLGKHLIINDLHVPGVDRDVEDVVLNTHGRLILVTSEIELYPYLQEGTKYKEKFGPVRDPQTTFAFQAQYGFPTVSVVLPGQEDAIAVVKKMMTQDARDLPWSAALEELGLDRRQFKNFAEVADGILITRNNAHIQFADVDLEEELEYDITEQPKDNVKNLNASLRLSRSTRSALREVLPNLLATEGQPTVLPMGRRRTGN